MAGHCRARDIYYVVRLHDARSWIDPSKEFKKRHLQELNWYFYGDRYVLGLRLWYKHWRRWRPTRIRRLLWFEFFRVELPRVDPRLLLLLQHYYHSFWCSCRANIHRYLLGIFVCNGLPNLSYHILLGMGWWLAAGIGLPWSWRFRSSTFDCWSIWSDWYDNFRAKDRISKVWTKKRNIWLHATTLSVKLSQTRKVKKELWLDGPQLQWRIEKPGSGRSHRPIVSFYSWQETFRKVADQRFCPSDSGI